MAGTVTEAITAKFGVDMTAFNSGMKKAQRQTDTSTKKMSSAFGTVAKAVGSLGLVFGAIGLARKILDVNRETEKLEAQLKAVTGSAEAATIAFEGIEKFASETPFQIEEIARAFVKLKSLGLDPSEAALRSYGNTASAMGMDLQQFIEAVADASTNEFERLKEFGIKAKQQGDQVALTFQGVTTTVRKNAKEITGYLQDIGNITFATGMSDQVNTIDGSFSLLADNLSTLARTLGKAGVNEQIKKMSDALVDFTGSIAGNKVAVTDYINDVIQGLKTPLVILGAALAGIKNAFELLLGVLEITAHALNLPKLLLDQDAWKANIDEAVKVFKLNMDDMGIAAEVVGQTITDLGIAWTTVDVGVKKTADETVPAVNTSVGTLNASLETTEDISKRIKKEMQHWDDALDQVIGQEMLRIDNLYEEDRIQKNITDNWERTTAGFRRMRDQSNAVRFNMRDIAVSMGLIATAASSGGGLLSFFKNAFTGLVTFGAAMIPVVGPFIAPFVGAGANAFVGGGGELGVGAGSTAGGRVRDNFTPTPLPEQKSQTTSRTTNINNVYLGESLIPESSPDGIVMRRMIASVVSDEQRKRRL